MPLKFLITAGPTREYLDPVRFISNPSTGKMGYALASSAKRKGHDVLLVSGPTLVEPPRGVKTIFVTSADEMKKAVFGNLERTDVVIMAAAVSDFKPAFRSAGKVKKEKAGLFLRLKRNPDILMELGRKKHGFFLAGFAAETDDLLKNALAKLRKKKLDMIVANRVGKPGTGFGAEYNEAVLIAGGGELKKIPRTTKKKMADIIIRDIVSRVGRPTR